MRLPFLQSARVGNFVMQVLKFELSNVIDLPKDRIFVAKSTSVVGADLCCMFTQFIQNVINFLD